MIKRALKILARLLAVSVFVFTVSCAGQFAYDSAVETSLSDEEARLVAEGGDDMFVNDDIYFEFDSSALSQEAKHTLLRKDYWMKNNPQASIVIEGHCDERGTDEYNLALGERRAVSAKNYLVNLGNDESKIDTISYGEERPVDTGHNEDAWQKNRRAHFVIE